MSLQTLLFTLFFIFIYSCGENKVAGSINHKTLNAKDSCICSDLILDELYNHFYLDDRTLPFTGTCKEYHKNGNLFKKIEYLEGKMDGVLLEYSKKNVLIKKNNFSKNMMHGDTFTYDKNGLLIFHGTYRRGKLDSVIFKLQ